MVGRMASVSALMRAAHPLPTVAVTAFTTALAASAGNSAVRCVLVAVAVIAGQLTIGWTNDRIDVVRDRQVLRSDKPIAMGEISTRTVELAIGAALVIAIGFSLALGWRAGLVHLGAVGCGWIYNAWLKRTLFSWLPYAVAFGALPWIATLTRPDHAHPAAWVVIAAALLGVAANFTNVL
ncbi:MAG: UbiA family prenyltransferase, partial [Actinobacteria bacterium]|nr:UbiA family prenyltransferase [Actinomycetota bacterium]